MRDSSSTLDCAFDRYIRAISDLLFPLLTQSSILPVINDASSLSLKAAKTLIKSPESPLVHNSFGILISLLFITELAASRMFADER